MTTETTLPASPCGSWQALARQQDGNDPVWKVGQREGDGRQANVFLVTVGKDSVAVKSTYKGEQVTMSPDDLKKLTDYLSGLESRQVWHR